MGPIEKRIFDKLTETFKPVALELENESYKHSVPAGSETHFRLVMASAQFQGVSRVQRQRQVYDLLKEEMSKGGVHALAQKLMSEEEWTVISRESGAGGGGEFTTPDCLGGSKQD